MIFRPAAKIILISATCAAMLAACGKPADTETLAAAEPAAETAPQTASAAALATAPAPAPAGWEEASATLIGRDGNDTGSVVLRDTPGGGMLVRIAISGLSEGWHGIHLHKVADCSDNDAGFKASGGHINPTGAAHGLLNEDGPEAADMPNIHAGANGVAVAEIYNPMLSLQQAADADGFAIVIHASPDDHLTQPIGGAGERLACAAINGV